MSSEGLLNLTLALVLDILQLPRQLVYYSTRTYPTYSDVLDIRQTLLDVHQHHVTYYKCIRGGLLDLSPVKVLLRPLNGT